MKEESTVVPVLALAPVLVLVVLTSLVEVVVVGAVTATPVLVLASEVVTSSGGAAIGPQAPRAARVIGKNMRILAIGRYRKIRRFGGQMDVR
ncbi:hypothetical protein [Nannocystis sp.]|uniref:hypothetical protein n=1 Tax=Nannocystis sp. TaxID=1962667 RepID=UPI002421F3B6|nr:hypothetical protein [Nannocystis sp.]MBK7829189.1 hypothetical protein [Nannocystis sp.]MBK9751959.1 hypothetical protein [Nannocystis sp.]